MDMATITFAPDSVVGGAWRLRRRVLERSQAIC